MNGYERRLAEDKREIRRRVVAVGERVRAAVEMSVESLLRGDRAECARVILGDLPINREVRSINKLCHAFIARHLPSAGHLRFVSAVLQMNIGLERIGDYAVTIAREGAQLSAVPEAELAVQFRQLVKQATVALRHAMQAFDDQNAELARETKPETAVAGRSFDRIHDRLQRTGGDLPLAQAFALVTVAHRLMRVGDQAKNICEETLFELTGETKPPKRYEILFVDARDTLIAPLAVALARKAFPASGRYSSAGYRAGENLAPELVALAEELSLDLAGIDPTPLSTDPKQLEQYHVIVALAPDVRRQLGQVPYATVLLEWQLPGLADVASGGAVAGRLREVSQYLSNEISDLMVTMRGEDAG